MDILISWMVHNFLREPSTFKGPLNVHNNQPTASTLTHIVLFSTRNGVFTQQLLNRGEGAVGGCGGAASARKIVIQAVVYINTVGSPSNSHISY